MNRYCCIILVREPTKKIIPETIATRDRWKSTRWIGSITPVSILTTPLLTAKFHGPDQVYGKLFI